MPKLKLEHIPENLSQDERKRLGAIILAHLTWPQDSVTRDRYLLEPMAPRYEEAKARHVETLPPTSNTYLAYVALQKAKSSLGRIMQAEFDESFARLEPVHSDISQAINLLFGPQPPTTSWAKAAVNANYFLGFDRDGRPHSQIDLLGRNELQRLLELKIDRWCLAGQRLYYCAQLKIHHEADSKFRPSLKKASNLLEDLTAANRDEIDTAWSNFQCISHLAAGTIQVAREMGRWPTTKQIKWSLLPVLDRRPDDVLKRAVQFQIFGLEFTPKGSLKPVLNKGSLWHLPPVKNSPSIAEFLDPLCPVELNALKSRAKSRAK